jgi:glycosyltransferase involved in cell wall biosynthesis
MSKVAKIPLRIGYVWQYETADTHLSTITAVSLHIRAVINEFEKRGHQVRIVTFYQNEPHWSDNMIDWHPVEPVAHKKAFQLFESILRGFQSRLHLPFFNLFDSYKFTAACKAALSDRDILYERFWMLASSGMMISQMLDIPIIYEVNGDIVEEYHQQGLKLPGIQWAAINLVTRYMFKSAGHVVPVSQTLKEKIISRYRLHSNNISVIENGARVDLFTNPNQEEIAAARSLYELGDDLTIIFVGTFKPWHGIDLLVDAYNEVARSYKNVKLILVGDGPLMPEIQEQVATLNLGKRVVFTGLLQHHEVPTILNLADIAVLNPKVTGASSVQSPLKLFEYMAAGKAIVAPKISNVERIIKDRESGLLVDPDNLESLKTALIELLNDKQMRKRLGRAAREQAIEHHSWGQTVSKIEAIMMDLIKKPDLKMTSEMVNS